MFVGKSTDNHPKPAHFYNFTSIKPQWPGLSAEVLTRPQFTTAPRSHHHGSDWRPLSPGARRPQAGAGGPLGGAGAPRCRPAPPPPVGSGPSGPGRPGSLRRGLVPPGPLPAPGPPRHPGEPHGCRWRRRGESRSAAVRAGSGRRPGRVTPAPGRATAPSCHGRCRATGTRRGGAGRYPQELRVPPGSAARCGAGRGRLPHPQPGAGGRR